MSDVGTMPDKSTLTEISDKIFNSQDERDKFMKDPEGYMNKKAGHTVNKHFVYTLHDVVAKGACCDGTRGCGCS